MFCPKCGSEINQKVSFCPVCGTNLSGMNAEPQPVPSQPVRRQPVAPAPVSDANTVNNRNSKSKLPIILAAVIFLVIAVPVAIFAINYLKKPERSMVNLSNYLNIEFSGEDGSGIVDADFQLGNLLKNNEQAFSVSKKTRKFFARTMGKEEVSDEEIYRYLFDNMFDNGTISVVFSPDTNLSNGDTVNVSWNCPESTLEELFPVDLVYDNRTYQVKGLEEKKHEHVKGKAVKENVVEATCSKAGSYDEVVYCSDCGEELSRKSKTQVKLDHIYKNGYCIKCGEDDPDYRQPVVTTPTPSSNQSSYTSGTVSLPVGGLKADATDFYIPDSSSRYLSYNELDYILNYDKEGREMESQMLINEIFARYGYTFTSSSNTAKMARNKFEAKSWYIQAQKACPVSPGDQTTLIERYMNVYEKANIKLINSWQENNIPR